MTQARRLRRMAWLTAHAPGPVETSHFKEESRFTHFRPDGPRHVYRRRGKRFTDACVDERDRF